MWDSGIGLCVGCGKESDRDILGRCDGCFRSGLYVQHGHFKEMGIENPEDPKGSTAHVRDIKMRRLDTKTKQMYYQQPRRTYI